MYCRSTHLLKEWWRGIDKRRPCLDHLRLEWWIQSWIWCNRQQGPAWWLEKFASFDYRWQLPSTSCYIPAPKQILPQLLPCQWKSQLLPKLQLRVEQRLPLWNISTEKLKGRSCLQHQGQWRNLPWNYKHKTSQVQRCQALFEWSLVWDLCPFWKAFKPQGHCRFDYSK